MTALVAVLATVVFLAALAVLAARLRLLTIRLGPAPKPPAPKETSS
jgi:hypothetical protein